MDACPEDTSLHLTAASVSCNSPYDAAQTKQISEEEQDRLLTEQDLSVSEPTVSPPGSCGPGVSNHKRLGSHGSNVTTTSAGEATASVARVVSGVDGTQPQVNRSNDMSLPESLQNRVAWLEGDVSLLQMRIDALQKPEDKSRLCDIKQLVDEEVQQSIHKIKGQISVELIGSSVEALESLREQCKELTAASADAVESLRLQYLKHASREASARSSNSPDDDVARCEEAIAVLARRLAEAQARLQAETSERCAGLAATLEDMKSRLHLENEDWRQSTERKLKQLLRDCLQDFEQDMEVLSKCIELQAGASTPMAQTKSENTGTTILGKFSQLQSACSVDQASTSLSSAAAPPNAITAGRYSATASPTFPGPSPPGIAALQNPLRNVNTSASNQSPALQPQQSPPCVPPLSFKVTSLVGPGDSLSMAKSPQDSPREALSVSHRDKHEQQSLVSEYHQDPQMLSSSCNSVRAPTTAPMFSNMVPMLVRPQPAHAGGRSPQMPTPRLTPRDSSASRCTSPMMEPVQSAGQAKLSPCTTAWHWPPPQSLPPFSLDGKSVASAVLARCPTPRGGVVRSTSINRGTVNTQHGSTQHAVGPTPMGPLPVCSLTHTWG